tara:strand:- start:502 stop:711 length:210 start_codon:yes stop_codon:yes gene_type:complete
MKKFIYDAVRGHFVSEKNKAVANIKLHTGNPVGVGEHPKIIEDIIKLVHKASEAQDSIEMLDKIMENEK